MQFTVLSLLLSGFGSLSLANEVLLSHNGIHLTFDEAFAYSLRHTNPEAYLKSISRPRAALRVLENLYVLERASELAKSSPTWSAETQRYLQRDIYRRSNLELFLDSSLSARLAEIDWDGLAAAEYAVRKQEFLAPVEVRVEHLLVSIEKVSFEQFVDKVRDVQVQMASGQKFELLIAELSDDPSVVKNGGDLGFFTRDRMQPTFSEAAFSLTDPGDVIGPVMTRFGAHFIRLIDRKGGTQLTFNQVKDALIKDIKRATQTRLREEFLSELRSEIEESLARIDEQVLIDRFSKAYQHGSLPSIAP